MALVFETGTSFNYRQNNVCVYLNTQTLAHISHARISLDISRLCKHVRTECTQACLPRTLHFISSLTAAQHKMVQNCSHVALASQCYKFRTLQKLCFHFNQLITEYNAQILESVKSTVVCWNGSYYQHMA